MANSDDGAAASRVSDSGGLNDLLNGVGTAGSDTKRDVVFAHGQLQDATTALREAVARLDQSEDDAWRHYGAEIDKALAQMDDDLSAAEAQLRIEEAESRDQLSYALQQATDSWRARADEIRVQMSLGEMEARDAGLHALEDLDRAGHDLHKTIEELRRDTAASVSTVRDRTRSVVGEVRSALHGVADAFRGYPPKAG